MKSAVQEFGERLRELRTDKNLSTRELAEIVGVTSSTISKWENQKRVSGIESLRNIAIYFGVTSDYLLGLED